MQAGSRELLLSFTQIAAMLRARRLLIAIIMVVAVAIAAIASVVLPKTYVAEADIFIDYRVNDPIAGRSFHPMQDESYLQTQFDMIASIQVAERVIQKLNLMATPDAQRFVKKYGEQGGMRALAEAIIRNIEIAPRKNSRVIVVRYASTDRAHARDVVNTVLKSYVELSLEVMSVPAKARKDQYNAQLENLSQQMDDLQKKLTQYQRDHQIVDADERADRELKQMAMLNARLIDVQMQRVEAQAKRASLTRMIEQGNVESDIPEIANIGHISGIKAALISLDAQLANAKVNLGPNHPRYITIQQERNELLARLKRESATAMESVRAVETRLAQQEGALKSELNVYQKNTFANKQHRDVISSYQRQLDSVQKIYNAAIQKFDELLMTSNVVIPNASVLQWAELPEKAAKPLLKNNLIFGLIAGLLFGLSTAFLLELWQRRVRCLDDLQREMDIPVMAKIGQLAKR